MKLKTIRDIKNLRGKRVLLRIDANTPLHNGQVVDDFRLRSVLPTIEFLSARGAVVIILSHIGRPLGKKNSKLTLAPVARRLAQISGKLVTFVPDIAGIHTKNAIAGAVDGQILMLENLRFDRGEESNSGSFAKKLSSLGDIFVNDGFAVSHRAHASVSAITRYLPSYAGFIMEQEIKVLNHVMEKPVHPAIAMVGGAKIKTKIGLIKELSKKYDKVLLGGGLGVPVLSAKGFGIGSSLMEPGIDKFIGQILKMKNLVLPVDVLVGQINKPNAPVRLVPIATDAPFVICKKPEGIVDIGPRTILAWAGIIKKAKTIVWNGPVGVFEIPKFSHGTIALARLIASRTKGRALGVVGGGETVEALNKTGLAKWVDHVSTGGGAMLEYLEGKVLPGIKPLYKK